jgi:hypothetical protein
MPNWLLGVRQRAGDKHGSSDEHARQEQRLDMQDIGEALGVAYRRCR